jgi:hypothetical protein
VNNVIVGFREITAPIISESTVHRAERVPEWRLTATGPQWRALCGVRIGETHTSGLFEFEVPVALDPELAASRQLSGLPGGHPAPRARRAALTVA